MKSLPAKMRQKYATERPLLLAAVIVLLFAGFLMAYAIEQLYLRYPTKNMRPPRKSSATYRTAELAGW